MNESAVMARLSCEHIVLARNTCGTHGDVTRQSLEESKFTRNCDRSTSSCRPSKESHVITLRMVTLFGVPNLYLSPPGRVLPFDPYYVFRSIPKATRRRSAVRIALTGDNSSSSQALTRCQYFFIPVVVLDIGTPVQAFFIPTRCCDQQ